MSQLVSPGDEKQDVLVLECEGPSFDKEKQCENVYIVTVNSFDRGQPRMAPSNLLFEHSESYK